MPKRIALSSGPQQSRPSLLAVCRRWLATLPDANVRRDAAWRLLQVVALRLLESATGVEVKGRSLEDRLQGRGPTALLWREVQAELILRPQTPTGENCGSAEDRDWLSVAEDLLRPFSFSPVEAAAEEDGPTVELHPGSLSLLYEQLVVETASRRRLRGTYFTPRPVVEYMVRQALGHWLAVTDSVAEALFATAGTDAMERGCQSGLRRLLTPAERRKVLTRLGELTLCDPAVGAGEFLVSASSLVRQARHRLQQALARTRYAREGFKEDATPRFCGIDLQSAAVAVCRLRLALACQQGRQSMDVEQLLHDWRAMASEVVTGDGLLDARLWPQSPGVVIGNPPYLSARHLLQQFGRAYKRELAENFAGASGAYDLFALFCEAAQLRAAAGAVISLIVPNKLMAADYAQPARRLFAERQVLQLTNLAQLQVFADICVYPIIVTAANQPAIAGQRITLLEQPNSIGNLATATTRQAPQQACCPTGGEPWSWQPAQCASREALLPLAQVARVEAGVSGFSAHRLLGGLVDAEVDPSSPENGQALPLVVTRNIDPYRLRPGPVRYLKRQFANPWLWADEQYLSAAKLAMFQQAKIVIGGLGLRLEAAYAGQPLAVGVQVMCVTRWECEPLYLLAALNSDVLSDWYRRKFGARQMSGGYLGFHRGQLAQAPIPRVSVRRQRTIARRVADLLVAMDERDAAEAARHRLAIEKSIAGDYRGHL